MADEQPEVVSHGADLQPDESALRQPGVLARGNFAYHRL